MDQTRLKSLITKHFQNDRLSLPVEVLESNPITSMLSHLDLNQTLILESAHLDSEGSTLLVTGSISIWNTQTRAEASFALDDGQVTLRLLLNNFDDNWTLNTSFPSMTLTALADYTFEDIQFIFDSHPTKSLSKDFEKSLGIELKQRPAETKILKGVSLTVSLAISENHTLSTWIGQTELVLSGEVEIWDGVPRMRLSYPNPFDRLAFASLSLSLSFELIICVFTAELPEGIEFIPMSFFRLVGNVGNGNSPRLPIEARFANLSTKTLELEAQTAELSDWGFDKVIELLSDTGLGTVVPSNLVPRFTLQNLGLELELPTNLERVYGEATITGFPSLLDELITFDKITGRLTVSRPLNASQRNAEVSLTGRATLVGTPMEARISLPSLSFFLGLPDGKTISIKGLLQHILGFSVDMPDLLVNRMSLEGNASKPSFTISAAFQTEELFSLGVASFSVLHAGMFIEYQNGTPAAGLEGVFDIAGVGLAFAAKTPSANSGWLLEAGLSPGQNLSLKTAIEALLPEGLALPEEVPDLLFREFNIALSWSQQGPSAIMTGELSLFWKLPFGDARLDIDRAHFHLEVGKGKKTVCRIEVDANGKLTEELVFEKLGFKFNYDGENNRFALSGEVTTLLFGRRDTLEAYYEYGTTTKLKLSAKPSDKKPLFRFPFDGDPLLIITPTELTFSVETDASSNRTWTLISKSSLSMHAPGVDEPAFSLEDGTMILKHDGGKDESSLDFTAKSISLFSIPYTEAKSVAPDENGELKQELEQKNFQAKMGFERLRIKRAKGKWSFDGIINLGLIQLPYPLNLLLNDTIKLESTYDASGLQFTARNGLKELIIPDFIQEVSKDIEGLNIPPIGEGAVKVSAIGFSIGKVTGLSLEFGVGLPSKLNEALGLDKFKLFRTWDGSDDSLTRCSVSLSTKGVSGNVLSLPFNDVIPGVKVHKTTGDVDIDFDEMFSAEKLGKITIKALKLQLDTTKGTFAARGGYTIHQDRPLGLPLQPLKNLLTLMKLASIADRLPKAFPIKTIDLDPAGLKELIVDSEIPIDPMLIEGLNTVSDWYKKLPKRLREDYLRINVPSALDFSIDITGSGGISASLTTGPSDPLQMLVPTPAGLQGIRLTSFEFGTALAGRLFKVGLSAEFDFFDYPSLVGSLFLYDVPAVAAYLPERDRLQNTLYIENFTTLIVIAQAGVIPIPIPIPLFYKRLEVISVGLHGFEIHTRLRLPQPTLDILGALKFLNNLRRLFMEDRYLPARHNLELDNDDFKEDEGPGMNLVFFAGPLYLRLPKYLGSDDNNPGVPITLGPTKSYRLFDAVNILSLLINSAKDLITKQSTRYFVQILHLKHRRGKMGLSLYKTLKFEVAWVFVTPKEFFEAPDAFEHLGLTAESARVLTRVLPDKDAADHEGLVTFLRGSFSIANVMKFHGAGGIVAAGRKLGTGFEFEGRLGTDLLYVSMGGLFILEPKDKRLLLSGRGTIELLGLEVLSGKFELTESTLLLDASAMTKVPNSPIHSKIKLEGEFTNKRFYLEGEASIVMWKLSADGKIIIDISDQKKLMVIQSRMDLAAAGFLNISASAVEVNNDFRAHASIKGNALGVIGIDLNGALTKSSGSLYAKGDGNLTIFGESMLKGEFELGPNECTFSGVLNLFPGIEKNILTVGGSLNGKIKQGYFSFDAAGHFSVGPFKSEAIVRVEAGSTSPRLEIELRNFFGADIIVFAGVQDSNSRSLTFTQTSSQPLKIGNGILLISSAENNHRGPNTALAINIDGLKHLNFTGAATFLGLRSAGKVNYGERRWDFLVEQSMKDSNGNPHPFLRTDVKMNGFADDKTIYANTELTLGIDLGGLISELIGILTGIRPSMPEFIVAIRIDELSFKIDSTKPHNPEDPELERLRKAYQNAVRAHRDRIRKAKEQSDETIKALDFAIINLNIERERSKEEQRKKAIDTMRSELEELKKLIEQNNNQRKHLEIETKRAREGHHLAQTEFQKIKKVHDDLLKEFQKMADAAQAQDKNGLDRARDGLTAWAEARRQYGWPEPIKEHSNHIAYRLYHWWGKNQKALDEARAYMNLWLASIINPYNNLQESLKLEEANLNVALKAEQAQLDELNRKIQDSTAAIKKSNGHLTLMLLNDRIQHEAKIFNHVQANEANIGHAMKQSLNSQSVGGGLSMHIKLKMSFQLGNHSIQLIDIHWGVEDLGTIDFSKSIVEQLPDLIRDYLSKNLLGILGQKLDFLGIVNLLRAIVTGKVAASEQQDLAAFVAGYAEMTVDEAREVLAAIE